MVPTGMAARLLAKLFSFMYSDIAMIVEVKQLKPLRGEVWCGRRPFPVSVFYSPFVAALFSVDGKGDTYSGCISTNVEALPEKFRYYATVAEYIALRAREILVDPMDDPTVPRIDDVIDLFDFSVFRNTYNVPLSIASRYMCGPCAVRVDLIDVGSPSIRFPVEKLPDHLRCRYMYRGVSGDGTLRDALRGRAGNFIAKVIGLAAMSLDAAVNLVDSAVRVADTMSELEK